jgi:hypothetical protein
MRSLGKALWIIGVTVLIGLLTISLTVRASQVGSDAALHVDAIAHETLADAGDTEAAALVVAVTSDEGVLRDLSIDNFVARAILVPPGGCQVTITDVTSQFPGTYLLAIVPFAANPDCPWLRGRYALGVFVTSEDASGAGVAELLIDL